MEVNCRLTDEVRGRGRFSDVFCSGRPEGKAACSDCAVAGSGTCLDGMRTSLETIIKTFSIWTICSQLSGRH